MRLFAEWLCSVMREWLCASYRLVAMLSYSVSGYVQLLGSGMGSSFLDSL